MRVRQTWAAGVAILVLSLTSWSAGQTPAPPSPPGVYTITYAQSGAAVRTTIQDPNGVPATAIQFVIGDRLTIRPASGSTGDRIGRTVHSGSIRHKTGEEDCGFLNLSTCSVYGTEPAPNDSQSFTAWEDFGGALQLSAEGRTRMICLHGQCGTGTPSLGPTMVREGIVYVAGTSGDLRPVTGRAAFVSPPNAFQNCTTTPTATDVQRCEALITAACQGRTECGRAEGDPCRIECGSVSLSLQVTLERP